VSPFVDGVFALSMAWGEGILINVLFLLQDHRFNQVRLLFSIQCKRQHLNLQVELFAELGTPYLFEGFCKRFFGGVNLG
jgi:hypothetical protein